MSDILKEFTEISKAADKANGRLKEKRFIPMIHGRNHKITEIGMYDSKTKKYALTDVRAFNAADVVKEMQKLIRNI